MIRYVFADDKPLTIKAASKANAQRIGEALARIAAQNGGNLSPHDVVEAARADRHPLHRHFEWDDAKAAEAYRLDQARHLIRIVRVERPDDQEPVRAFISVADRGVSYRTIDDVLGSARLQAIVLDQAQRDLEAFEKRYRELEDVCSVIADARAKIADRRKALAESRAPS